MNKQRFQFKTNINCSGCVAAVSPYLDSADGVASWEVDITNKDKILTVESDGIAPDQVVAMVEKAGYKITPVNYL